MAKDFSKEAWRRGYDIKFGLAAIIMQSLCMAPISAAAVVAMFFLLRRLFGSDRTAFWLSLLYAFGTPVFYRTGYLNHNLILGHFAFFGFLAMWNPHEKQTWSERTRYFLGGLAGGAAVLLDYSGVVLLFGLFIYGIVKSWPSLRDTVKLGAWYVLGSIGPIALLWFPADAAGPGSTALESWAPSHTTRARVCPVPGYTDCAVAVLRRHQLYPAPVQHRNSLLSPFVSFSVSAGGHHARPAAAARRLVCRRGGGGSVLVPGNVS
jgi:hypothetical protein